MSRSIGEPLAYDTTDRAFSALDIIDAESDPVVMPEIELSEIAVKVLLADVLVGSIDAALKDGKEIFCGIGRSIARERIPSGRD
jgi:hypothetical protein